MIWPFKKNYMHIDPRTELRKLLADCTIKEDVCSIYSIGRKFRLKSDLVNLVISYKPGFRNATLSVAIHMGSTIRGIDTKELISGEAELLAEEIRYKLRKDILDDEVSNKLERSKNTLEKMLSFGKEEDPLA